MNPVYVRLMAQRKESNVARLTQEENKTVINAAAIYCRTKFGKTQIVRVEPLPFGFAVVITRGFLPADMIEEHKFVSVNQACEFFNPPAKQLGFFGR
jgi:hypothetical protein